MIGYTKLFENIVASTIWQEDAETKVIWITMLALKNQRHMVEASLPGLAKIAGVTLEKCEEAIKKFESPDKYSRSQAHDGRRIEKRDGGWYVLNGEEYQRKMGDEERREYNRLKMRAYRKNNTAEMQDAGDVNDCAGVTAKETMREKLTRLRREDPLNKQDAAVMRKKWSGKKGKEPTTMAKEYDLDEPKAIAAGEA